MHSDSSVLMLTNNLRVTSVEMEGIPIIIDIDITVTFNKVISSGDCADVY